MAYLEQHGTDPVCSIDVLGLGASAAGEVAHRSESGQEQAFGSRQPSMVIKVDEIPQDVDGENDSGRTHCTSRADVTPSRRHGALGLKEEGRFFFVNEESELFDEFGEVGQIHARLNQLIGHVASQCE